MITKFIKLLPSQVPIIWDTIKWVAKEDKVFEDKHFSAYSIELLHELLNDRAQCFVRIDEKRQVIMLMVFEIVLNRISQTKHLHIELIYSWQELSMEVWKENFDIILKLAKKKECKFICFNSSDPKIWHLVKKLGFKKSYRHYRYFLEG